MCKSYYTIADFTRASVSCDGVWCACRAAHWRVLLTKFDKLLHKLIHWM